MKPNPEKTGLRQRNKKTEKQKAKKSGQKGKTGENEVSNCPQIQSKTNEKNHSKSPERKNGTKLVEEELKMARESAKRRKNEKR